MPKTLVDSEPKSNPYITKTINKSLLTPCRRVGLSRKRKTPNSSSSIDNKSFTDSKTSSSLETTPVNTESEKKESSSKNKSADASKSRKKNKVSKRLIVEEEDETELSNNNIKKLDNEIPKVKKSSLVEDSDEDIPLSVTRKKPKLLRLDSESDSCSNKSVTDSDATDFKTESNTKKYLTPKSSQNATDFKTELNIKKDLKPKSPEKATDVKTQSNMKKDLKPKSPQKATDFKTESNMRKNLKPNSPQNTKKLVPVVLKEVTNIDVKETPPVSKELPKKVTEKKIKRSLSMKKSSEETMTNCSVNLQPLKLEENSDSSLSSSKITLKELANLEKTVQEKRNLLDELKRAEIYQTKHNVKELEKLTSQWKSGCISALNDLLPHLQNHAPIDMDTLLKNLRVPNHLVSLKNDELV